MHVDIGIALMAVQYKIYFPVVAFDLPTQSVSYIYIALCGTAQLKLDNRF